MGLRRASLVIGYGNRLRGDDAVGPRMADEVERWGLPGVEAIAVHQLTPELAGRLAEVSRVLFVDATAGASVLACRRVHPAEQPVILGHSMEPGGLLGLALRAFGRTPEAWFLTIPATQFAIGAALSPVAQAGLEDARSRVRDWLEGLDVAATESADGP